MILFLRDVILNRCCCFDPNNGYNNVTTAEVVGKLPNNSSLNLSLLELMHLMITCKVQHQQIFC